MTRYHQDSDTVTYPNTPAGPTSSYDPWATPGSGQPPYGGGSGGSGGGGGGGSHGRRRRPGWFALGGTAVASAVAASLLTAGLVGAFGQDTTAPAANSSSTSAGASVPVQGVSETTTDWQKVIDAVEPSVVTITVQSSTAEGEGSGIVYDAQGLIVTNNHVVTGAGTNAKITVTLNDGSQYAATIVGTDPATDLAVIKLTDGPGDLTPATFADSGQVVPGQPVMALGNPLGLSGTATTGIVSAIDRPVITASSESQEQQQSPFGGQSQPQGTTAETAATNAIQTDAAINPGNSGGPLLDTAGRVIGINSSIASLNSDGSTQSGSIGVGFAIPANEVKLIADQLIATGSAQHAWLGVSLSQETATVTVDGAGRSGAGIVAVEDGTPAAEAGLQAGDVVTAVDGKPVNGYESLTAQIRGIKVGTTVQLTVVRDGKEQTLSATLTARQES